MIELRFRVQISVTVNVLFQQFYFLIKNFSILDPVFIEGQRKLRLFFFNFWSRLSFFNDPGLINRENWICILIKPDPINLKPVPQPWIWQLKFQIRILLFGLEMNPLEILQCPVHKFYRKGKVHKSVPNRNNLRSQCPYEQNI